MKKNISSLLICLAVLFSVLPAPVYAAGRSPFDDVTPADWYYDGVLYAYEHSLMDGTGGNMFSPNGNTTRGTLVTILYRLEGKPAAGKASFSDVGTNTWYYDAVAWASSNGIVDGYDNGKFGPDDPLSREQMSLILYRYAKYKGVDVSGRGNLEKYADASEVSTYARESMAWANANELITGTDNNQILPKGIAIRAQTAVILMRFSVKILGLPDDGNPGPDYIGLVVDAYSNSYPNGFGETCEWHIPKIVLPGNAVKSINDEIWNNMYENAVMEDLDAAKHGYVLQYTSVEYEWAVNGDVLSLLAWVYNGLYNWEDYYVYNVSVVDGTVASKQDILSQFGLSEAEFTELAKQALYADHFDSYQKSVYERDDREEIEFANEALSQTISTENIALAQPFINNDGELCIVCRTYSIAGADYYYSVINLNSFELPAHYPNGLT